MTQYVLKTSIEEADAIVNGDKSFVFRDDRYHYGFGDEITFQAYKNGSMTRHKIEGMKFRVTYTSADAPVEKGFKIIGFKRIA